MTRKYLGLLFAFSILGSVAMAQQKLSDYTDGSGISVHGDAILELASKNKGLLHTRVSLVRTTDASPLQNHVAGMMVYNTVASNDVVPGIYYNDGSKWILASAGKATNISYNPTDYILSFTNADGNLVNIDFKEVVKANETVTTLAKLGEGKYEYTSEDGTKTTIDVAQDVVENFETIVNESNTEVIEQLITVLGDTYVGGNVYYDGDTFTYVDEAGESHVINFEEIVQANETVTTLAKLGEGKYEYTSEDGTKTTIDVAQDVVENFETIVNESNTEVIEQLITVLGDTYVGGNVYYDGDTFTYVDEAGESHVINFEEIVQANETVTTLAKLGEGKYEYTSEDGTKTTIDVAQDVVENFETIVNESNTEVIEQLITVLGDTYVGGNVYYDGDTFTYVDEAGESHVINFEEIVQANETVTTLAKLGEGKYEYTSEDGTKTTIDVAQDVVENFETIVNESNTEVIDQLITVLGDTYVGGNVYYDGDTFTYVDEAGESHVINFEEIVQANETVTTLAKLGEGKYEYTSEDGTKTTIDVAQDVVENFETIVNESNTEVIEQLITVLGDTYVGGNVYYDGDTFTYVDEAGESHVINFEEIVQANETVTTLAKLGEGKYEYTSEDGTKTTIDVAQDVVENFETIVNESNTEVIEQLITVLGDTYVGGNVYYDGDRFTYVDEAGESHVINFEEIVQANETVTTLAKLGEGKYEYTSEDGTKTTIDVAQDVVENFETIVNESNTEVIEQLITVLGDTYVGGNVYYDGDTFTYVDEAGESHVINFEEIVQANETVTTLAKLGEGKYEYTSEDGTKTTIDVAQDVVENFETIVNESNTEVIEQLITVLGDTYVGGNVYYDGDTFTYVDEAGQSHVINFEEIVQANETVTTLAKLGEGKYEYTSEDGTKTTIDVAQDVVENFETIVNESNTEVIEQLITVLGDTYVGGNVYYDGDTFTYVDEAGESHVINFEEIVKANETVTTLTPVLDASGNRTGEYVYKNESGTDVSITVAQDVIENFETIVNESNTEVIEQLITVLGDTYVGGNVYYDGDTFTYVDEAGESHVINFEEIVQANETVTTLTPVLDASGNRTGEYVYKNESGTDVSITVAQDVIENFETIVNESNTEVIEQLITVLGDTYVGGNVYYDGDTFTYVDEAGESHVINFEEIVQANETVTTFTNTKAGNLIGTYKNEAGADTDINESVTTISMSSDGQSFIYKNETGAEVTVNLTAGAKGDKGEDGKSAYEIAVEDGFVGTETEWLESLKGAKGEDGIDGQDGLTPEIGSNGNWFIGSTDTGIKAQGPKGDKGDDGLTPEIGSNGNWFIGTTDTGIKAQGPKGDDGIDGQDGLTPEIGSNGNWFIGSTDTGIKAQGPKGDDGIDGQDGLTPEIGSNGNWFIGTTDTGIKAQGPKGDDGIDGQDGLTPEIGSNGNWFIGSTDTGIKAQGPKGDDGIDGQDGLTPEIGSNGNWFIGATDTGIKAQGPKGDRGEQGPPGVSEPQYIEHSLLSSGNDMTSTINGESKTASIINTNVVALDPETNELTSTINGVGAKVDLSPLKIEPWQVIGGTEKATENTQNIYQMGNVAVGTTTIPTFTVASTTISPKFHVAGDISTTGKVWTTNSVYADYVFEKYFDGNSDINKEYEFKSLDYVKAYVAENKHLPGVTKIDELLKGENGYVFDMTQLSIQQLEKIEELFLHVIEQQELISKQQAEIDDMNQRLERLERLLISENKLMEQSKSK